MNSDIDRKIAVILVADVVSYSKHMERDENIKKDALKTLEEIEKISKS
mgnify:CR=1 FL=1